MRNCFFLVVDPGWMSLPKESLARSREKKDVFFFVFLVVDPAFDAPRGLMPGTDRPLRPLGTPLHKLSLNLDNQNHTFASYWKRVTVVQGSGFNGVNFLNCVRYLLCLVSVILSFGGKGYRELERKTPKETLETTILHMFMNFTLDATLYREKYV